MRQAVQRFRRKQKALAIQTEHIGIASEYEIEHNGMTLRQYAAIKLKVPNSGTDWLDEMIEEANRLDREMLTGPTQSNTL